MELRHVKSFLAIAETLHFGRTAELIHLSQPALSLQIQALEHEVGVKLFERNRRETKLTAAGFAFRDHAAAAVIELEEAVRRARLAADGKVGLLRIGFVSGVGNEIVPQLVRQFRESNPEVELSLHNILTLDQIRMLDADSLDIGFLRLPIGEHPELEVVGVHREPFVLVLPSSHRLAYKKKVQLRDVADEDFVLYERAFAPGFYDLLLGIFRDAGIIPTVRQTAGQMPTLISLVASGVGISVLPTSAVKHSGAAVVACDIRDALPLSEIGLAVHKRNRSAIVDHFLSLAMRELAGGTRLRKEKANRPKPAAK